MIEFMFRDEEIKRIQTSLQNKDSILLLGVRRTGKTMLMKEIVRRHAGPGKAIYFDVSNYTSLYSFYNELMANIPKSFLQRMSAILEAALPNDVMEWVRRHIDNVDINVGSADSQARIKIGLREPLDTEKGVIRYWEPIAKAMLESLQDSNEIAFFAIDEFPFMLINLLRQEVPANEITVALATLRKLRAGIPILLSGSVSLDNLIALHSIPGAVLGDLLPEKLCPFKRSEARSYLEVHLAGSPAATQIETVLDCLPDFIPFFLRECVRYLQILDDASNVDVVMENQVLPAIRRSFAGQFHERLKSNYPDTELLCAEQLLDQLAEAPENGAPINTKNLPSVHRQALTKLKYDMFIEEAPGYGYRFTLNILRLWWLNQRGVNGKISPG